MTNLIVDASVAVRWFAPNPAAEAAKAAVKNAASFAPDLILAEVGNALWKAVRAQQMPADIAVANLSRVPDLFHKLEPAFELYMAAFELSVTLNHPIYDCFYLALAKREGASLVTADKRLAGIAQSLANVEIRLLATP